MSKKNVVMKWNDITPQVAEASKQALSDASEFILDESNKLVPHDEGTLERSGIANLDPENMMAYISYDTPYAVRLHEHPEYDFQKGRQGKWLESAMNDNRAKVQEFLKNKISGAME